LRKERTNRKKGRVDESDRDGYEDEDDEYNCVTHKYLLQFKE